MNDTQMPALGIIGFISGATLTAILLLAGWNAAWAQFTFTSDGGLLVSDPPVEQNTGTIAQSVITGGMAGGFDPLLTESGDLEQQVSSQNGLPLTVPAITTQYGILWPGYGNASYNQGAAPGSPEGDMATTLGTLHGSLLAGANQQSSQADELGRLSELEGEIAGATGILQVLEVSSEIGLFNSQQDMKLRNGINAQLNAMNVAESNRQNQEAQDQLESLAIAGEQTNWDATNYQSVDLPPVSQWTNQQ